MKSWLEEKLLALNGTTTMNKANGFTRLGYSEEEWSAMNVFQSIAHSLGLAVRRDAAGNMIARWETRENQHLPAVATGSHLDTVINGGGYDGVAGVLTGLAAIKRLQDENFISDYPIEVICFASEESSRFNVSTFGSKAMAGLWKESFANLKDRNGTTLKSAMESLGLTWERVPLAERSSEEIKSFIELHIEQGPVLENKELDFGVVDGIACPIRLLVKVTGKAGHTGTTPMTHRNDALVAIAPLITFVQERAIQIEKEFARPIVATVSTMKVEPNAMNVIPETVTVGIDIRSVYDDLKAKLYAEIETFCTKKMIQSGIQIDIQKIVDNPSIFLNKSLSQRLKQVGESLNYKGIVMNSGAGHDVMNMAQKWPTAMLFIPCRDGLSHHPDEFTSLNDLHKGTEILAAFLRLEAMK
ncbi:M20 family metallo-hydrolase [Bacillus kwashiorkori]|uniref:M20 family metallo-hydrolase n=1 Tax=Bacillus kwashiorkori TaxID=1522318 RepID=UPI00078357A6|nr:M20 family metallo-hydrolase [Bacillus kwashiorkori]